ncbi:MAG: sulfate adenylyltransferase [Nitrososphaerota archaeon]|jgi:sulfate adenylyltransferase|nr:sulfate adenylyltransferase [Nitrososphaerota archaeon]MDG6932464.1 sulfate adenylyltransferase [Nitrososphaerota archaeon]MDG6936074.1 sulfate adenylyltransferase [Nitrososphaerota archaeon]MDG6943718.1 sulfate adenylyltransferase [Nitrososphaerota archaeon]
MIPEPYGGKLVENIMSENEASRVLSENLPRVSTVLEQVYDAEKIAIGAFSPIEGFMGSDDYNQVLEKNQLSNGLTWPIPIVLTPPESSELDAGDEFFLNGLDGQPFALMKIEEKYKIDKGRFAEKAYGTRDIAHPNVLDLQKWGEVAISGKVSLLKRLSVPAAQYEYTPKDTRRIFEKNGWKNVAAYQARNPPHMAHEFIQRMTLERDDIDGLFIQPVIGKLKKGDYKPEIIMKAYEVFVKNYYREDRVLLGSLSIAMRYAGPKAVLLYAIMRRNYGCSHYIVGRDQAGVGSYYDPYDGQRIFDRYDVGVKPVKYDEVFYCTKCGMMVSSKVCPHGPEYHVDTSQTKIRKLLVEGKQLPLEILRPEVAQILESGDVINQ